MTSRFNPEENFTAPINIGSGWRIHEFVFRKLVSWAMGEIRKDIDRPNDNVIDDMFPSLACEERDQIRKYIRDNKRIDFAVNWPPHDAMLPVVTFINGTEAEDPEFSFMGDFMGTSAVDMVDGVITKSREEIGVGLKCVTDIFVVTEDVNLTMYLYALIRYIVFVNKMDLHSYYDIRDLIIDGQDLRWDQSLWPSFAYIKVIRLRYNSAFSVNTRGVDSIRLVRLASLADASVSLSVDTGGTVTPVPGEES